MNASLGAIESVMEALRKLARGKQYYIKLEEFIDQTSKSNPNSANHSEIALSFLEDEARALRVTMNGIGHARVLSLSATGIVQYNVSDANLRNLCNIHAADYGYLSLSQGVGIRTADSQKCQAQMDYFRTATILSQIQRTFEVREPQVLIADLQNLPGLVRQNLDSVVQIEDINQNARDQFNQTIDRLMDYEELAGELPRAPQAEE